MINNRITKWLSFAALGLSLPLLGERALAQNANQTLWQFSTDGSGVTDLSDSWAAFNWGGSTVTFDPNQEAHGLTTFGSAYITADPSVSQNAVIVTMFYPNNHPETGNHIYWSANPLDLTGYTNVSFDIKWDNTNSTRNIADFNYPPNPYGDSGIKFQAIAPDNSWMLLTNVIFPSSVTNGWVHMNIPINPSIPGINSTIGFAMQKYYNDAAFGKIAFWMENIHLDALQTALPPPTVKPLATATPGLNSVASSSGQYDRHIGRLRANSGKSWVGHATAANPVTYSFTVKSFPQDPATFYGASTLLFLIPNPAQNGAGAPDYNEANCVQATIQQHSATQSSMNFQYKVNDGNDNNMFYGHDKWTNAPNSWDGVTANYFESGNLGSITYAGPPIGTWTVEFTSDTNVILIAPDGSTNGFIFPAYNAALFAESTGFNVDLGMQPNASAAVGKAVIYSNFAISNTVTPFSENFLTDTNFDTVNIWDVSMSPANSFVLVPATVSYSASWTLPAVGFSLEVGSSLTGLSGWTSPTKYPVINSAGTASQFVDNSELPAGNVAFFNLIKRTFTQLQVLLPGETNAPGTVSGKGGTPTPQSASAPTTLVVNACDSRWNIIQGATDVINITSSDNSAFLPNNQALVSGTTTFTGSSGILFQTQGTQTVTATDVTDGTKTAGTSSNVTVGP